jgi:hypothetical protein
VLKYLVAYLAVGLVLAAADAVWLSSTGASLYRQTLGDILEPQFRLAPAVLFYLLYVAGILIFVMTPAFATGNWTTALLFGALYGIFLLHDLRSQQPRHPAQLDGGPVGHRHRLGHGLDGHLLHAGLSRHAVDHVKDRLRAREWHPCGNAGVDRTDGRHHLKRSRG